MSGRCAWLPGRCAQVAGEMCKGCQGDVQKLTVRGAKVAREMCNGAKVKLTPSPRPKTGEKIEIRLPFLLSLIPLLFTLT